MRSAEGRVSIVSPFNWAAPQNMGIAIGVETISHSMCERYHNFQFPSTPFQIHKVAHVCQRTLVSRVLPFNWAPLKTWE